MNTQRGITELQALNSSLTISTYGAQVLDWTANDDEPLLYMSPLSLPQEAHAIRGGIPVCFPWFGRADLSPAHVVAPGGVPAPSHGFARTSMWEKLDSFDSTFDEAASLSIPEESVSFASYRLRHDGASGLAGTAQAFFPHSFDAELRVRMSSDLIVTMSVTNTDDHEWVFESALHSYFMVGDVKDVVIRGLEGAPYIDALKNTRHVQRVAELSLVGPTDRLYTSRQALTIEDPRARRKISIDSDNTASVIVWNPWLQGAGQMTDLPDCAWENFVCVEVGNVRDNAVSIDPGQTHTMSMRISTSVF